jgi:hypothetical protein
MTTKRKIGIVAVVVALLLIGLLTEGVLIPKQLQPNVLPIRLLSVTTMETGREAVYELRNESRSTVDVWGSASLNVGTPDDFELREIQITPVSIGDGKAARISLSVPDEKNWQLMLRVARHGAQQGTIVFSEWSSDRQR